MIGLTQNEACLVHCLLLGFTEVTAFDELQWYSVQQSYTITLCNRLQVSTKNHYIEGKIMNIRIIIKSIINIQSFYTKDPMPYVIVE